jgi:Heavy metal binding domain
VTWNYTTFLNIAFLALSAVLVVRFLRTGGPQMLRMMNAPAAGHPHANADHGDHGDYADHGDHADHASGPAAADEGYACPMHPEVHGGPEDRCPRCGMRLERRDDSTRS